MVLRPFPPSAVAVASARHSLLRAERGQARGDTPLCRAGAEGLHVALCCIYPCGHPSALRKSMDGLTVSVEAQTAIEKFLKELGGEIREGGMPRPRSDKGSCYILREFRVGLDEHGLRHARNKPHWPEEHGVVERSNRTLRESLDGEELTDLHQARDVIARRIA